MALASFNFASSRSPTTLVDCAATAVTDVGFVGDVGVSLGYPTDPEYTTNALANTSPSLGVYLSFTINRTTAPLGTLYRMTLRSARGGAATPRGFEVRTSADGFGSVVASVTLGTARPTWSELDLPLGVRITGTSLEVRIYPFVAGAGQGVDFDDITVHMSTFDATSRRQQLTTLERSSLLDLDPWVGQRSATFRFDLVDGVSGVRLGEVHPLRDSPPTITHDVTRTIKRQMSPFLLGAAETAEIDPVRHRVLPVMVLGNGEEWPLGRFMFTDHTRIKFTSGELSTSTMLDEMFIVDQKTEVAFTSVTHFLNDSFFNTESVDITVERLIDGLPVTMEAEPTEFYSVGAWQQGTNRGQILDSLATDGDYLQPWFNNLGVLKLVRSFDPATRVPDFDWDATAKVMRDSISEVSDLLDAWNRLIVVSNNPGNTSSNNSFVAWDPIVGVYDVPASAPHSFANRGFRIVEVRDLQISTGAQARVIAQNIGQRETVFERVELSTAPDPRHDSHNVIRWNGANWQELSWALPLQEGAAMRHVLRKVYL